MPEAWRCGDCGALWSMDVKFCRRPFDDYLALRGGTVEAAISRAIERELAPLITRLERKWNPRPKIIARPTTFTEWA